MWIRLYTITTLCLLISAFVVSVCPAVEPRSPVLDAGRTTPGRILTVAQDDSSSNSTSTAETSAKKTPRKSAQPISITADEMEADDNRKRVSFSGRVVAKHMDVVLACDRMVVFYRDSQATGSGDDGDSNANPITQGKELDRIEAEGNVKVTRGKEVAQAQKAVYLARAFPRKIVLTGEPRIWREKNFLTGNKITVFVEENRSIVEGGRDRRVNAIFYQSETGKENN